MTLLVHDLINLDLRIYACVSVYLSVTQDLRNRSMDHSEILGDVGGQISKNRHTAAFLIRASLTLKQLICAKIAI